MTKFNLKAALAATLATSFLAAPAMAEPQTGDFDASATIVKPLTMTITDDLLFGSITLLPTLVAAEDVSVYWDTLAGAAAVTCSTNLSCTGTVSVPHVEFTAGVGSQTVGLTYSALTDLTFNDGTTDYTLAFSHDGPSSFGLTDGEGDFYIGGTISVPPSAVEGTYSGTVDVTADYN